MAKEELRKSVYRIFSDLVKQDDLITVDEIEFLENVYRQYGVTDDDRVKGYLMTLGEAVSTIQGQSQDVKDDILKKMRECALMDNECGREEALLLTATKYCCLSTSDRKSYVRSFPANNNHINDSQLIYLENEPISDLVALAMLDEEQYADLCNICRLAGFEYIYIPKIVEHFRKFKHTPILHEVISLVSPSLRKNEINSIIQVLCGMSTTYFYRNVLRDKLQLPIRIDKPIWMFQIGHSVVRGEEYVNFLCVEVGESPKKQLRELINEIVTLQSSVHIKINKLENKENTFQYSGFHKTLLDMMAIKRISAPDLVIHTVGNEFALPGDKKTTLSCVDADGNRIPIIMDRREAAFYVLLLCACARGGKGVKMQFSFNSKEEQVLQDSSKLRVQYGVIYNELSNWASIPDIAAMKILRPTRSYIAKSIKNTTELSPQALYMPIERNGYLMLSFEADHVWVVENGKEKRRSDPLYRSA